MKRLLLTLVLLLCAHAYGQSVFVGYVSDDDQLKSIPYDGYTSVCSLVDGDIAKKYAGNQVVGLRIAFGSTAVSDVRAYLSPDPSTTNSDVASASVAQVEDGWNNVMFSTPYTLVGTEEELYVGYDLKCSSTEARPVLLGSSTHSYGLLVKESDGRWYDYSETGDLAVQLIISGDKLPDYDVAITDLYTDSRYYKADAEKMYFGATLQNNGTKPVPGLTLSLMFDGNPQLGGELQVTEELTGTSELSYELPLSSFNLAPGIHSMTLSIKELSDGLVVSPGTTADDSRSYTLYIYSEAMERRYSVFELFASADQEYYQSRLIEPVEEFLNQDYSVLPVFIHGSFGEGITDNLAITTATKLATAAGLKTVPSFGFNRSVQPGMKTYLYGYTNQPTAADFAQLKAYLNYTTPAFATISLGGTYDSGSRLLTLDIQGTRGTDFQNFFGDGALTIYLTEDNVNGQNHVLRRIMTAPLGNAITWNGDNGLSFQLTRRLTLDREWNADNMHAIAFIHKVTTENGDRDKMEITNADVFNLNGKQDAITNIRPAEPSNTQTYDLSGRSVNAKNLQPGIYIQNGRKVAVK